MSKVKSIRVEGREWHRFLCEFDSPDGRFGFEIHALSIEHAAAMLCDLKDSARLRGRLEATFPAEGTDD